MLTITIREWVEDNKPTKEVTFECDEVIVNRDAKNKVTSVIGVTLGSNKIPDREIFEGWVYVMNSSGKTIQQYSMSP